MSAGPKFILFPAYVVRTPENRLHEICKVKEITLNYKNSLSINFNSIRRLIIEHEKERRGEEEEEETST